MSGLGKTLLPALMLVGASVAASAQQKACDIDEGTPAQVARAYLAIQQASSAKPEDAAKQLRSAVKLLGEGDLNKNGVGRAMVLGKTLTLWMQQPSMKSGMTTRGALGFTTDTTRAFDLVAGIDSAFSVVEKANPECAGQTAQLRRQQAWVDLVNKANELSDSNPDSATALVKRSLQLLKAPEGYGVLAQVQAKKGDVKGAIASIEAGVAASVGDTTDYHRRLLVFLGDYAASAADTTTNASDKAQFISAAKGAYDRLAKDPGNFSDNARGGQARVALLMGDTASIRATYADQLANPGAFTYNALMAAGVSAARINQTKDAIKLFESAQTLNPYHRDVLYNLGRLYMLDSSFAKGIATAQKLIEVDPSNPDNYQLLEVAYGSLRAPHAAKEKFYRAKADSLGKRANKATTAAARKIAIDSSVIVDRLIKAYSDSARFEIDSALKYQAARIAMPAHVSFTQFAPTSDGKTWNLVGNLFNNDSTTKSYSLKVVFVDKAGNAVATQDVPVGPVEGHRSAPFKATGTGAGIVAFRYSPLK